MLTLYNGGLGNINIPINMLLEFFGFLVTESMTFSLEVVGVSKYVQEHLQFTHTIQMYTQVEHLLVAEEGGHLGGPPKRLIEFNNKHTQVIHT